MSSATSSPMAGLVVVATAAASSMEDGDQSLVLVTPPTSPMLVITSASSANDGTSGKPRKKSVCFHPEAKTHDGICERNTIFDSLVAEYFVQQQEISELDVLALTGPDLSKLGELLEDFSSLVARIEESAEEGKNSAPILPRGGGLCMKLCLAHVPYIKILATVVEAALNRTMRAKQ